MNVGDPGRGRRTLKLDLHLLLAALPVLALVPMLAFAVVLMHGIWKAEQEKLPRELQQMARTLAVSVQRELNSSIRQLERIGDAPSLSDARLEGFYQYMKLLSEQGEWSNLILSDGRHQLLNAAVPFGAPLPPLQEFESQALLADGKGTVTNVSVDSVTQQPSVSVVVPVRQGGSSQVLIARLSRTHLANLLQEPLQDFDITSSVVDGNGHIVSRNRDFDRFFGRSATPSYLAAIRSAPKGFARSKTLDGRTVLTAWHRMENGWTVGVGVDPSASQALLRTSLARAGLAGAGLLALSLALAVWLSRRISRAIRLATQDADAMSNERPVSGARSEIVQVDQMLQAHQEASLRLRAFSAERNLALERLRQEVRRRDEFLSMLAHELRNPLAPIVNVLWLLERSPNLGEKERKQLAILSDQTRQLTRLVNDLLDASRLVGGKVTLQPRRVSFTGLVRDAVEAMRPGAAAKAQQIELDVPEDPIEIVVDPDRISQILHNLLANAMKFSQPGGRLQIRVEAHDADAEVSVRDDGIGIDPARMGDLFVPFSQIDPDMARSNGGLGLGLSTSLQLAQMHGGGIRATSEGLGKGAVFTLTLPRKGLPVT